MALPPVHPEPARRRRFIGGTRGGGVLRDGSALGESFWTDDRGRLTEASPKTSYDLASGRGLSENRRPNGLPLAGRRRRGRGPRRAGPVQAKQARRAETDAQAPEEVCLRSSAVGHRRLAIVQRRGPGSWDRTPARARAMEVQSS